ncbi:MAG: helix-turn-helix domain-containing protein [Micrococcales bacterium]|nr:helix-turn-helix domain-containing protein [Micrococcales bacterium]
MDALTIGRTVRHRRRALGMTLQQLAETTALSPSALSMLENARREPRLSQLEAIAQALGMTLADVVAAEPPDERSRLEVELSRLQESAVAREAGVPAVVPRRALPLPALRTLVALHRELQRRALASIATPEEARRANTDLRRWIRERENFLPEIETEAEKLLAVAGHAGGALTHHEVDVMAASLGLSILHVTDLPHSTRTVTDLENKRIYLPPASIPGGHGLRALALQAMAHRVLQHRRPVDYADFLRQRLEINYFSSACLMPRAAAVAFLEDAKKRRDLAVEDFRDAFGVTHEAAAMRMTNLATRLIGLRMHFLRVSGDGAVVKAYENDDLALPADASGSVEGQPVPRAWAARAAFERTNRTTEFHQITDTASGTFWCSTQTGRADADDFSITVGVRFADSKWFRGRDTPRRADASASDGPRAAEDAALARRWTGKAWPSARMHAHVLSPLPFGTFPGVDDVELHRFLEEHAG